MGIIYTIVEAMEFLDKLIEAIESYNTARCLNNQIYAKKRSKVIEIDEGIDQLADLLGEKLEALDTKMPHFNYKGYIVFQYKGSGKDE